MLSVVWKTKEPFLKLFTIASIEYSLRNPEILYSRSLETSPWCSTCKISSGENSISVMIFLSRELSMILYAPENTISASFCL
ncbi:hypothetical protein D3C71_990050 [compost metagenome]